MTKQAMVAGSVAGMAAVEGVKKGKEKFVEMGGPKIAKQTAQSAKEIA